MTTLVPEILKKRHVSALWGRKPKPSAAGQVVITSGGLVRVYEARLVYDLGRPIGVRLTWGGGPGEGGDYLVARDPETGELTCECMSYLKSAAGPGRPTCKHCVAARPVLTATPAKEPA